MTVLGELCYVALPFCCVVAVALPFCCVVAVALPFCCVVAVALPFSASLEGLFMINLLHCND